jgi:hypothetical protein
MDAGQVNDDLGEAAMPQPTDLELLDRVGVALFRDLDWAPQLARFLGAPLRTMQRIAKAHREGRSYPVPQSWFEILHQNLRAQAAIYASLADELEARAAERTPPALTDLPELLAAGGGYITWEHAFPHGPHKADVIQVRDIGGNLMVLRAEEAAGPPTVTRALLEQWVREERMTADPWHPSGYTLFKPVRN